MIGAVSIHYRVQASQGRLPVVAGLHLQSQEARERSLMISLECLAKSTQH
jgi:hypothetical protein